MFRYNQYCPVAKTAEILGDRWTILIVRELLHGTRRFNEFHRNLPGISRSVLSERLQRLEELGVLQRDAEAARGAPSYQPTEIGRELQPIVFAMGSWGARWLVSDPEPQERDPDLIMLFLSRRLETSELPQERVVVEFQLRNARIRRRYWLVFENGTASLCLRHPGFESDLNIAAEAAELQRVYMGRSSWEQALRTGAIEVEGPSALRRGFPRWMAWSPFAEFTRRGE